MKEITQDQADNAVAYALDASEAAPFDVKVEVTDYGPNDSGFQDMLNGMRELGMQGDADVLEAMYNDVVNDTLIYKTELRKSIDALNKKIRLPAKRFASKARKTWR